VKRCIVAYALPQRQWLWDVSAPQSATVAELLAMAREAAGTLEIPWEGPVGIHGAPCARSAVPRDGDRIEIYRPLKADPKESRRERAKAGRAAPDQAARRPSNRSRS
jgi:putative ubiquitin-RnfH superfamily antitoxin RatB of RatAB toxin-antitoxin module